MAPAFTVCASARRTGREPSGPTVMVDAIFTVLPHYLANLLAGSNNRELKYPRKYVADSEFRLLWSPSERSLDAFLFIFSNFARSKRHQKP